MHQASPLGCQPAPRGWHGPVRRARWGPTAAARCSAACGPRLQSGPRQGGCHPSCGCACPASRPAALHPAALHAGRDLAAHPLLVCAWCCAWATCHAPAHGAAGRARYPVSALRHLAAALPTAAGTGTRAAASGKVQALPCRSSAPAAAAAPLLSRSGQALAPGLASRGLDPRELSLCALARPFRSTAIRMGPAGAVDPSLAAATMAGGQSSASCARSWPLDPNSLHAVPHVRQASPHCQVRGSAFSGSADSGPH